VHAVQPDCWPTLLHVPPPPNPPDLEALASLGILELKVLREAARQAAPDAVCVQLQGLADLLHLQEGSRVCFVQVGSVMTGACARSAASMQSDDGPTADNAGTFQ
jgi:hypothetical protein